MNASPPLRASAPRGFLLLLAVGALTGCAEDSQEIIAIPGYPPFNVTVSPGVAPGLSDGCEGETLPFGRLRGLVYYIAPETRLLPDFRELAPVETICLDRLDVTPRRSVYPAFPGIRERYRWFAVDMKGQFEVETPGLYSFRLTSDDGSQLYVDDALVVDNDGYHPPRSAFGSVRLGPGAHTVRVAYWQGPGPLALVLDVAPDGDGYRVFRVDEPL